MAPGELPQIITRRSAPSFFGWRHRGDVTAVVCPPRLPALVRTARHRAAPSCHRGNPVALCSMILGIHHEGAGEHQPTFDPITAKHRHIHRSAKCRFQRDLRSGHGITRCFGSEAGAPLSAETLMLAVESGRTRVPPGPRCAGRDKTPMSRGCTPHLQGTPCCFSCVGRRQPYGA